MRILILLILLLAISPSTYAQDLFPEELLPTVAVDPEHLLKGGEYQLELSPLEEQAQKTDTKKIETLSAKEREEFNTYGFVFRQTEGEMTLSLSTGRVGLGTIAGGGKHTGQVEVTLTSDTPTGYALLTMQQTPEENTWDFPPTICDGGQKTCTTQKAALWQNEKAIGFGYTVSGVDAPNDFKNSDYYRPLRLEYPVMIAGNEYSNGMRPLKMTFNLHTSPATGEGIYGTNVEIVALSK